MSRALRQARSEVGALRSRLELSQIRVADEEPQPIDHKDLLPLVHAIDLLLLQAIEKE